MKPETRMLNGTETPEMGKTEIPDSHDPIYDQGFRASKIKTGW